MESITFQALPTAALGGGALYHNNAAFAVSRSDSASAHDARDGAAQPPVSSAYQDAPEVPSATYATHADVETELSLTRRSWHFSPGRGVSMGAPQQLHSSNSVYHDVSSATPPPLDNAAQIGQHSGATAPPPTSTEATKATDAADSPGFRSAEEQSAVLALGGLPAAIGGGADGGAAAPSGNLRETLDAASGGESAGESALEHQSPIVGLVRDNEVIAAAAASAPVDAGVDSFRATRSTLGFTGADDGGDHDDGNASLALEARAFESAHPWTLAAEPGPEQLVRALQNMAAAHPPVLFAGHYILLQARFVLMAMTCTAQIPDQSYVRGGQAVVNFARDPRGGFEYAIKLFHKPSEYVKEIAFYTDPVLSEVLPRVLHSCANADGAVLSRSGLAFPPFLVLERGMTLAEWRQGGGGGRLRNFFEVCTMAEALARLLARLHGAHRVHRDLKPDNVLLLAQSAEWKLLDMGIVATTGDVIWPRCTPAYADPDTVLAAYANRVMPVSPAQDIWALGVMAYEAITGDMAVCTFADIKSCASGAKRYPWEAAPSMQPRAWRTSRLRAVLEPCLLRSSAARPTAEALLARISKLGQSTSTR